MDIGTVWLLFTLSLLVYWILKNSYGTKTSNGKCMPPGPKGLPLIGSLLSLKTNAYRAYVRFMKYGEVCTVRVGMTPMIVLNSYRAIQTALINQADIFSGRPKNSHIDMITRKSGIVFMDGSQWQEHRRFNLRLLRQFGTGKSKAEELIGEEGSYLRDHIENILQQPVDTHKMYAKTVSNVISKLIFGERCAAEDPQYKQFEKGLHVVEYETPITFLPSFKWLIRVPLIRKIIPGIKNFELAFEHMQSYVKNKIKQYSAQMKTMPSSPKNVEETNTICEALLVKKNNQDKLNPGEHTFTDWQLITDMVELFAAGIDSTATTLCWATFLMSIHPHIQEKVQSEIEEQIGRHRRPTMADRLQLPYVSAVLDEIFRYTSIVTSGLPHRTRRDTELLGYFIPANTIVQINLYGVHHDPEVWERPDEFYPEHFLSPNGEYQPSKYLMPFSTGRRACIGESLARTQIFMIFVMVMQRYQAKMADPLADKQAIIEGTLGLALHPLPHEIVFSRILQSDV